MLKHAPNVYIPMQPEDDGIAWPIILSIVVHGAIVAFIIYSHRVPSINVPPTIETSIVTPDELASMQENALLNRNSSTSQQSDTLDSQATGSQYDENVGLTESSISNQQTTDDAQPVNTNSREVPVIFARSFDEPDEFEHPTIDSKAIKQIEERRKAKQEALEKFKNEQNELAIKKLEEYNQQVDEDYTEELQSLQEKRDNPTEVEKPRKVDVTIPASLKNNAEPSKPVGRNSSNNKPITIGGSPSNDTNGPQSQSSTASRSSSSGKSQPSAAAISNALVAHIRPHWIPPNDRLGKSVKATIKVDSAGNVLSVVASSSDRELNRSLEIAVRKASPLTPVIGTNLKSIISNFKVTE